jgi:hypothetical protein
MGESALPTRRPCALLQRYLSLQKQVIGPISLLVICRRAEEEVPRTFIPYDRTKVPVSLVHTPIAHALPSEGNGAVRIADGRGQAPPFAPGQAFCSQ